MAKPKSVSDLPHFSISSFEKRGIHPRTGQRIVAIHGRFNGPAGVREGRGLLLLPDRDWLTGDLDSLNSESGTAVFINYEEPQQNLIGLSLPYVTGSWDAYHVWMVSDPSWRWDRLQLRASEVIAEVVRQQKTQSAETEIWIRVRESVEQTGKERWYPATGEEDARKKLSEVQAAGWDHEHCAICWTSIEPGDFGFGDADAHWVCEPCYEKYVAAHDLSFLLPEDKR